MKKSAQSARTKLKNYTKYAESPCPNCGSDGVQVFYEFMGVPAHSVLLMSSRDEAVNYPRGDIELGYCSNCGFVFNTVFDPTLHEYSSRYEETQGFSSTFNAFHNRLAQELIDRFDLRGKEIIEIGCGKGDFLSIICELGGNKGTGFDPAFIEERNPSKNGTDVSFIKDFYSEKYAHFHGDFVCCKMTLEHIPNTYQFVKNIRLSLSNNMDSVVFFQIPNTSYILRDLAFWDIYYEHCSYFTKESLDFLFRRSGFEVLNTGTDYADQYLMIESRPNTVENQGVSAVESELELLASNIDQFTTSVEKEISDWKSQLYSLRDQKKKIAIWGGGSKGVAFLTKLEMNKEIEYAVDINPYKRGTYMAGTGQEIIGPADLKDYNPDVIIVMNPVYVKEISGDLEGMGLSPKIMALG